MKAKKTLRRALSLALALVMVISLVPAMNTKAATTKKSLTLYVGEAIYYTDYGKVKSVSSSSKSVVSVAKDKKNNTHANITPKKAGKATVTIKTVYGTHKLTITVKKLNFKVSMKDLGNGNILVSVKNNTSQIFDSVKVAYSLVDMYGNEVARDYITVSALIPDLVSYGTISYSRSTFTPDIESCAAKVVYADRSINYKYTNRGSKVSKKVTSENDQSSYLEVNVTLKNTISDNVSGYCYLQVYDCDNNLIGIEKRSVYLRGNSIETYKFTLFKSNYPAFDHYTISNRLYSYVRK